MKTTLRIPMAAATALLLAACADPDTGDERGYTKAPLENPGWIVDGEEPTAMAELGEPDRVPMLREAVPEDETGTGEAEAPAEGAEAGGAAGAAANPAGTAPAE